MHSGGEYISRNDRIKNNNNNKGSNNNDNNKRTRGEGGYPTHISFFEKHSGAQTLPNRVGKWRAPYLPHGYIIIIIIIIFVVIIDIKG